MKGSKKRRMSRVEKRELRRRRAEDREFEHFGCDYPERVASSVPFKDQPFGSLAEEAAETDGPTIVSLALFDEDEMLFACTGIAVPDGGTITPHLTRILTSARLVMIFNEKRNINDEIRIVVRVPGLDHSSYGFVELYDDDIAIVTSPTITSFFPVDLRPQETSLPAGTEVRAVGRAFSSLDLMVVNGRLSDDLTGEDRRHLRTSDCHITEAGLGGPLTDSDQNFVGMNAHCAMGKTWFLPRTLIREPLEQFQMLNPRYMEGDRYPSSSEEDKDDLSDAVSQV